MASRPDLKVDDEPGFVRFYTSLVRRDGDEEAPVRIFDRGDSYSAHGDDALLVARQVYQTTSVVRAIGSGATKDGAKSLPSVTMTTTVFRSFLRLALFKLGRAIEVYSGGGGSWTVNKRATPGNLHDVEEDLGGYFDAAPVILAARIGLKNTAVQQLPHDSPAAASAKTSATEQLVRTVGVCFADATVKKEIGVAEFVDNESFSNFESLLIQLGVRECIFQPSGSASSEDDEKKKSAAEVELNKLKAVAQNCGCSLAFRPTADFNPKDVEDDLSRLLRSDSLVQSPLEGKKNASSATSALLKYLDVLSDSQNYGQFRLFQHDLSQYMRLDAAALKAVSLMPGPRDSQKNMSLFGLLNHCKTPLGSRLLAQWLKQPLVNLDAIKERHDLVEVFMNDHSLRQDLQETHLRSIPDLYRLAKKFQRNVANLEDVVRAYQVCIRLPGFIGVLASANAADESVQDLITEQYTKPITEISDATGRLQEMVSETIDLDALDRHEYIITPNFDESLRQIRKKLDSLKRNLEKEARYVADDLNQDLDKKLFLENHRVHGHCLRLTRTEAGCIRNKKGYMEISTQKNGVYFTTQTLSDLRREYDSLSEKYNKAQSTVAKDVVRVAATYAHLFEKLAGTMAHLDVIVSFAHAASFAPTAYTRPKMYPRGSECKEIAEAETNLIEARHPCLEQQDGVQFITNNVSLAPVIDENKGGPSFLIVTGPNMGGKSTYIRMLAAISLMAQVGSFVPCAAGSSLTIYDAVLARVGASDATVKGVSTFMAEMLETASILGSATQDSLVVIDELGRGTSTYDGFGLAWAIAEHLISKIGCQAVFATHFHELTRLSDRYQRQVRNLHVVAHVQEVTGDDVDMEDVDESSSSERKRQQVTLLYKVEPGVSDQSFGIQVAELVKFPEKVVRMARRKADELESFSSSDLEGPVNASPEDVAKGSKLIKSVFKEWRERLLKIDEATMTTADKAEVLRQVMKDRESELKDDMFFRNVVADA